MPKSVFLNAVSFLGEYEMIQLSASMKRTIFLVLIEIFREMEEINTFEFRS